MTYVNASALDHNPDEVLRAADKMAMEARRFNLDWRTVAAFDAVAGYVQTAIESDVERGNLQDEIEKRDDTINDLKLKLAEFEQHNDTLIFELDRANERIAELEAKS